MKYNIVGAVAGSMIIIMFGMNMDLVQTSTAQWLTEKTPFNDVRPSLQKIIDLPVANSTFVVPMSVPCTSIETAEKELLNNNMQILATGLSSAKSGNEELIEIWMHPKKKSFAMIKLFPTLGISCLLSAGPILEPGGMLLDNEPTEPKLPLKKNLL